MDYDTVLATLIKMLIGRYPSSGGKQPPTDRSKIAMIMRHGQPKLNALWLRVMIGGSLDTSRVSPVMFTSFSNLTPSPGRKYRNHLCSLNISRESSCEKLVMIISRSRECRLLLIYLLRRTPQTLRGEDIEFNLYRGI